MDAAQRLITVSDTQDVLHAALRLHLYRLNVRTLRKVAGSKVGSWAGGIVGRALELLGVHVVFGFSLGEADDERGHGHFDVEFDDVDDGVELDVDDLVLEEHEADQQCL